MSPIQIGERQLNLIVSSYVPLKRFLVDASQNEILALGSRHYRH